MNVMSIIILGFVAGLATPTILSLYKYTIKILRR